MFLFYLVGFPNLLSGDDDAILQYFLLQFLKIEPAYSAIDL